MINKLTRLSPKNISDVANTILYQISASINIQNDRFARKRDILAQNAQRKGSGATSMEDSTKSAVQNKPKSKKRSKDVKFKKKKRNSKIKFVDTQEKVSSDSKVSSDEEDNSHSDWPMFTVSHSSRRKADAIVVSLNINIIPCKSELDTGASVTVIPENMW